MTELSKKEASIAAALGIFIGFLAGIMIAMSMIREHRKCEALQRENVLLHEIILQQQQELTTR